MAGNKYLDAIYNVSNFLFEKPVTFFRELVIEPNRKEKFYWYHIKYPRVPTIDECYSDDPACIYEAQEQFRRDFKVDTEIVRILKSRNEDCEFEEYPDGREKCAPLLKDFMEAELNLFIKYGDLGFKLHVRDAYMKQKHRLVFERRKAEKERLEKEQSQQEFI